MSPIKEAYIIQSEVSCIREVSLSRARGVFYLEVPYYQSYISVSFIRGDVLLEQDSNSLEDPLVGIAEN